MTDRRSCSSARGERSAWCSVSSGVPLGTFLGLVLFLVFINDLSEFIRSKIKLFADDAKFYRNIKEKKDHYILQEDLNNYSNWNKEWLLQPSKEKCEVLHVGNKQHHRSYVLDIPKE